MALILDLGEQFPQVFRNMAPIFNNVKYMQGKQIYREKIYDKHPNNLKETFKGKTEFFNSRLHAIIIVFKSFSQKSR
jgi:hypothetical protein